MRNHLVAIAALCGVLCSVHPSRAEESERIFPPPMPMKEMGPHTAVDGTTNTLQDADLEFVLYTPLGWAVPKSGQIEIIVHFHGPIWYVVQEHLRGGLKTPLIAFHGGESSGKYQRAFNDPDRFGRWLQLAEKQLSGSGTAKISKASLSSYGAGYSAIREILKSAKYDQILKRVVIAGTIYADYATDSDGNNTRQPADAQIAPYVSLAQAAARGEKTFVLTFSEVFPGDYAGSSECSTSIVERLGGSFEKVELDSSPAANVSDFPLIQRYDVNNLHVWGYSGNTPEANMTHARHVGDIWKVLNDAGKP